MADAALDDWAPAAPVTDAGSSDVDAMLLLVRHLENSGDAAVSPAGAVGRYQITPGTAKTYGFDPAKLTDPAYNETVARAILSDLSSRYNGNIPKTLVGWDAGPGTVNQWQKSGLDPSTLPTETQGYLSRAAKWLGNAVAPSAEAATPTASQADPWAPIQPAPAATNADPWAPVPQSASSWTDLLTKAITNTPARWKQMGGAVLEWLGHNAPTPEPNIVGLSPDDQEFQQSDLEKRAQAVAGPKIAAAGQQIYDDAAQQIKANSPDLPAGSAKQYAYQITSGTIDMLPLLAATELTKSPVVGATIMGAQASAQKYGASIAAGRTPGQAKADASFSGIVNGALGSVPLGMMMKPGQAFLGGVVKNAAGFGTISALTEAIQAGYDKGFVTPEMTLAQAWQRVEDAGITGTLTGGLLGAFHGGVAALRPAEKSAQPVAVTASPEPIPATTALSDALGTAPKAPASDPWAPVQATADIGAKVATPTPEQSAQIDKLSSDIHPDELAAAQSDVKEWNAAAPKGYSLFNAIKDLGGINILGPDGERTKEGQDVHESIKDAPRVYTKSGDGNKTTGIINNDTGLPPDQMREALQERGWFGVADKTGSEAPGADMQPLYDAMQQEGGGDKVFHPETQTAPAIARRALLDEEMSLAGVAQKDPPALAAAKLAAFRQNYAERSTPEMAKLTTLADAESVPYHQDTSYDELLGDVLERQAIRDEGHGQSADQGERLIDDGLAKNRPDEFVALGRNGLVSQPESRTAGDAGRFSTGLAPGQSNRLGASRQGAESGGQNAREGAPQGVELNDEIPFQRPRGPQGQLGIPGTEAITDRELAERRMQGGKKAVAPQENLEGKPLFDPNARANAQGDLKFQTAPPFFSALTRGVEGLKLSRAKGADETQIGRGIVGREASSEQKSSRLVREVTKTLNRIAPGAEQRMMASLASTGEVGPPGEVLGAAFRERAEDGIKHVIAWSLASPDAVGTVRHEAVHSLKRMGVINPKEWTTLTGAAYGQNWMQKYHIDDRYPGLDPQQKVEEAIAERFANWRQDRAVFLPKPLRDVFHHIDYALRQIAATVRKVMGRDATASDIFTAMESGTIGRREPVDGWAPAAGSAFQKPPIEAEEEKPHTFINKALGTGVDAVGQRLSDAATRFTPDPIKDLTEALKLGITPMAAGSDRARASAKDFANTMREVRWEWGRVDDHLQKNFTPDQRKAMWDAADQESTLRQEGKEPAAHQGLNLLTPVERAAVEDLHGRARDAFARAQALGMTKATKGLPSYVPRMVVDMTAEGAKRVGSGTPRAGDVGRNLSTRTGQLKQRKYLTAEETEGAAQAKFGEGATIVRDIRTLGLATGKLEQAVAGRSLIEHIKDVGRAAGEEIVHEGGSPDPGAFFTIDHPAFKTWGPKFIKDPESGKIVVAKDQTGQPIFEAKPLYISKEFEGPLRAVLSKQSGKIYQGLMDLKGKAMSVIMYSPLMHNAVIWGKAIPAAPRQVLTFQIYRNGAQVRRDPATMREALKAGLDPIGKRYFNQDLTAIAELPQIAPGRSWTAKLLGAVPGLFDREAGDAVKRTVDNIGDVWHNTFLWDRVADLQMGIYKSIRDGEIKKGLDPQSAKRVAAHFANRYAGALPIESMSRMARQTANLALFSRSFTLGNIGAFKDAVAGLPKDIQSQILRDKGVEALSCVQGEARRKAISMLAMDIGLSHLGLWLAAYAAYSIHRANGSQNQFQPPSENEPNYTQRFLVGYQKDGTAIYGRLPTGKVGEEMTDWWTEPLDTLKRKLSPYGRLLYEVAANDKGFGQKLYDPYDSTPSGVAKNIGRVAWEVMDSIVPTSMIEGAYDLATNKGDRTTNALKTFAPVTGLTVSKGAPGGPAAGQLYQASDEHQFQVNEAMPGVRNKIAAGDIAGARRTMDALGIPPSLQSYYIRTTQNPATRLTQRKLGDFNRYATPEEKARMQALRQPQAPTQ